MKKPRLIKPGPISSDIKGGIHIVHILLVQLLPQQLHGLAEPLEVDDLPFPEEFDHVVHIRIIGKPQNVVIGDPGLLLWGVIINTTKKFRKIGNKRLSLIELDKFLLQKYYKKVRGQAIFTVKYRQRLG